ncbi:MAG TPA: right-handed parallel beta-helix repeat-containing protein, partial [Actinomycetota bacterium]|nr:right-handed parallel beta-helix repeat-containing protein [Actinomycetota bacterium]
SNNVVIEDNDASHSLQSGFELGNGAYLIVRNNVANLTGGAGISIESGIFDSLGRPIGGAIIEGNTTNENRENGMAVADGGHRVKNNNAHNNAGFGIEIGENPEQPGEPFTGTNIDGPPPGTNKATGNGEPEQCSGLICEPSGGLPVTPEDIVPPDTEILTGPAAVTGASSAVFTFTGTDDTTPPTAMSFECRLDAPPDPEIPPDPDTEPPHPNDPPDIDTPPDFGVWVECASPFFIPMLEQGPHHLEVRALDNMENMDETPDRWEWEIDITIQDELDGEDALPPDTFIAAGPMGEVFSTEATFRFTGSDNLIPGPNLEFQCRLDGEPIAYEDCTPSPKTYSGLDPGVHVFEVAAVDLKGNIDPTPAVREWTILVPPHDSTPPDTSIDSGPDPITVLTEATFAFSSEDTTATFECKLNAPGYDTDFEPCTSPKTYTGLPTGAREFEVQAIDMTGNTDPSPAKFTWYIGSEPVPGFIFCGQVVRTSIKVRNDLADCLWDGLVVGAPNITIDLDGHTIDGKGIAAGIRNDGYDNVTIKNGKIVEFDWGVMLNPGTEKNIVEHVEIQQMQEAGIGLGHVPHPLDQVQPLPPPPPSSFDSKVVGNILRFNNIASNDIGVWLAFQTKDTLILQNEINVNPSEGVLLERSHSNRLEGNTIFGSSGAAVRMEGARNNTVVSNDLSENGGGVIMDITRTGTVGEPSNNNRIEKNTILEPTGPALEIIESDGNYLLDNVAHFGSAEGISLYRSDDNVLIGNDVTANKSGIDLTTSSGNRLEANDASDSGSTGISVASLSLSNVLLKNESSNNDGDGIYIGDETTGGSGSWVEGNIVNNNKGFGIFISKVSHVVKANVANDNGGWGIWADAGSNGRHNTDGGGNKAQGNHGPLDPITLKPLQCFTIVCTGVDVPSSDIIAPGTQLLETPTDPSATAVQRFRFDGSDNASPTVTFQCKLDAEAWGPCSSPAIYT